MHLYLNFLLISLFEVYSGAYVEAQEICFIQCYILQVSIISVIKMYHYYMLFIFVNFFCMFISYLSDFEIDITGVTEMSVNNTSYTLQNDSVVLQHDREINMPVQRKIVSYLPVTVKVMSLHVLLSKKLFSCLSLKLHIEFVVNILTMKIIYVLYKYY